MFLQSLIHEALIFRPLQFASLANSSRTLARFDLEFKILANPYLIFGSIFGHSFLLLPSFLKNSI